MFKIGVSPVRSPTRSYIIKCVASRCVANCLYKINHFFPKPDFAKELLLAVSSRFITCKHEQKNMRKVLPLQRGARDDEDRYRLSSYYYYEKSRGLFLQGFVPREQGSLRRDSCPYPRPPSLGYPREISPTQEWVGRVSPVASSRQDSFFPAGRLFPPSEKRPLHRNQYYCPLNVGIPYPQGALGIPTLDPQSLLIFSQGGRVGQGQTPRKKGFVIWHQFEFS